MKRIILLIASIALFWGLLTVCSSQKETSTITNKESISTSVSEQDVREMAFNQLTSKEKERIAGTWQDSKLSKITLTEGIGNIYDKSYIGKEVYLIDFPIKRNSSTNNMVVYLGIDNSKLIGYGYVD